MTLTASGKRVGRPPAGGGVIIGGRTHYPASCEHCGETFMRQQNKPERRFCSRKCSGVVRSGPNCWHLYIDGRSKTTENRDRHHRIERERWPEKTRTRQALMRAVKSGKVTRPNACERCGVVGRVYGHHGDYNRPYDVVWVCSSCHCAVHGGWFGPGRWGRPETRCQA